MSQKPDLVVGNYYPKYSTQNFIARYLARNFISTFLSLAHQVQANTCLDLGTGEGYLAGQLQAAFPAMHLITSDISPHMQQLATAETGLPGLVASAEQLPLADEAVELVTACEVLEHLPHPRHALAEIKRLTRRYCILSVPREPLWRMLNMARLSYLGAWGNTPGHLQHWSRDGFTGLVGQYFNIIAVRNPIPWTFVVGQK